MLSLKIRLFNNVYHFFKKMKHVYIPLYGIKNDSLWVVLPEIFIYVCVSLNEYVFLYPEKILRNHKKMFN